jgi:hypothetical protein
MKNWKMWSYAIFLNSVLIGFQWKNSPTNTIYDKLGLGLTILFIAFLNFTIGIGISNYSDTNRAELKATPFYLLSILITLIGIGVCGSK